ncbi:hypothetical protein GL286_15685 [Paracoccus aestuariivivens]|uniref:PET hydrolase/cutinase-like domain-containing protein n=1 Tax=Paracoccus aestuariivivens TaxID=1820333 RepID=A0A6L6JDB4_9RHOB|nr:hypothetical protein [Paracoccus aestuariivivens]
MTGAGNMLKRIKLAALGLMLTSFAACGWTPAPEYAAKGPVEVAFMARGPWQVSRSNSGEACTSKGHSCDIWAPTGPATDNAPGLRGGRHPVVAWANGSGQKPEVYAQFLDHLASWGFVVIAPRDEMTGNGQTVADAARYIILQGETRSSPFYGRIDRERMAAVGHSQGGASVAALHARNAPLFRTYMTYHISPDFFARWCCAVDQASYADLSPRGSIFHWASQVDSGNPDWYEVVGGHAPKAFALLRHAGHEAIGPRPRPYLGYSTAWLMWQLNGDRRAAAAFAPQGEFFNDNISWADSRAARTGL